MFPFTRGLFWVPSFDPYPGRRTPLFGHMRSKDEGSVVELIIQAESTEKKICIYWFEDAPKRATLV